MDAKIIVEKNKIFESFVGSKLYGTDLPTSDTDISGIFIPPFSILLGLHTIDQVDNSLSSKDENQKNTKEALDATYYSLHKFVNLAIVGSPNVLERLFAPKEKITFINSYGELLVKNRSMFITKSIIPKFLGYAVSQKHKMIIKTVNFSVMSSFLEFLNNFEPRQMLIEIKFNLDHALFGSFKGDHFSCGDLQINRSSLIKDAKRIIEERLSKVGNRKELVLKHGYDTKFSSHLIRLLMECKEIIETGELVLPLKNAEHIKDIKLGKFKVTEILEEATQLENEIRDIKDKNDLPEKADFNKVNNLVVEMTRNWNQINGEKQ